MKPRLLLAVPLIAMALAACGSGDAEEFPVDQLVCESALRLESYHYDSRTAVKVTAPAQAPAETLAGSKPDPSAFDISWDSQVDVMESGEQLQARVDSNDSGRKSTLDIIAVGGTVWQQSDPSVGYVRLDGMSEAPLPYPPAQICDALQQNLDPRETTPIYEDVNSIPSAKFVLEDMPAGYLSRAPSFGAGDAATVIEFYDGAIWVAKDGYISRLELSGSGEYPGGSTLDVSTSYEYSDINDVDVDIVAPSR